MVLPQALEFDQTPNRILLQKAEEARQQDMLRRKLEADNREKQFQVLKEINPATLYSQFEKEVVDKSIGQLTSGIANYIKSNPNASYVDLQNQVNKGLSGLAQWSARVKTVKDNINKSVEGADPIYEKGRLRALAIDRALYKTDEFGRKVFKSPEEIDVESDMVSAIAQEEPSKVIDPFKGQDRAVKKITDASLFTQDITQEIDTPNGKQTVITGRKSSLPFFLEVKDGKVDVKKGANGYISEDVFNQFYQDPAMKVWIDAQASDIMNKGGVPDSPEAKEYFKRSFLTNWLDQNKKGTIELVDKELYAKPSGVSINIGTGGPGLEKGRIPAFKTLLSVIESGEDPMSSTKIDNNIKNAILSIADENGKIRLMGKKYAPKMIEVKKAKDGSVGIYTKSSGELITSLSEQSFDMRVNEAVSGKAVGAAASYGEPTPVPKTKKTYNLKTGKYE